eukprot:TRINITY_DN11911_c0_g2_i2.p1 TRINITY_DN11911_c0_g2~~TRINITY_DN11911_c0_g2_i2.p1  ORF type:complete len:237 (-),score=53.01 TRINITY_DN11911_c0_g2_i2:600-1310(-)
MATTNTADGQSVDWAKYDILAKVLMLGESGVGKTSLMTQYCDRIFQENMLHTTGIDFRLKMIDTAHGSVKLQIWDTAGQERYHAIGKSYYKSCSGVLLVYDVTSEMSFQKVKYWMDNLEKHGSSVTEVILVANKIDLPGRIISEDVGMMTAREFKLPYIETTSKSYESTEAAFQAVITRILENPRINLSRKSIASISSPITTADADTDPKDEHHQQGEVISLEQAPQKQKKGKTCC